MLFESRFDQEIMQKINANLSRIADGIEKANELKKEELALREKEASVAKKNDGNGEEEGEDNDEYDKEISRERYEKEEEEELEL